MEINWPGEILSLISWIIYFISACMKNKKGILCLSSLSNVFSIASLLFFQSYSGIAYLIFATIRNFIVLALENENKNWKIISFIIFTVISIGLQILVWEGWSSILMVGVALIYQVAIYLDEQKYRVLSFCSGCCWLAYTIIIANYAGTICQVIALIVYVVSFIVYAQKKKI